MVFKNPYGYLIKNFKLIHLFLTALYIYLAIKVNSILNYYNHFIAGTAKKIEAINYINNYYLIASILAIIICIIIYALMRYKKKPRLLYLLLIGLYIVVPIMIYISFQGLNTIYFSVLETKTLRLYRDLLSILIWAQYLSIIIGLVRGLGFDIKKFDFVKDLQELNLSEQDEEEIELTLSGSQNVQRTTHRKLRELKYYYLENKSFIHLIIITIVVISCATTFVHKEVINKEYNEGEIFSTDDFRFQVQNTYITNKDTSNSIITNTDTTFVIIRINIGVNKEALKLNTGNLILKIENNKYSSNNKYESKFSDIGYVYRNSKISNQETYIFIYNINKEDINKKMTLEYATDKKVKLNPIRLDNKEKKKQFKIGDTLDLTDSTLNSGSIKIKSYKIDEKFLYPYQYEVMGKTNTSNLTITSSSNAIIQLEIEDNLPEDYTMYSFLTTFGKLKYKINNEEYISNILIDKTPNNYKEGLYLAIDEEIKTATNIWFEITIRNNKYIYTIK